MQAHNSGNSGYISKENELTAEVADYFAFIDETGDSKFHTDISIYNSPTVFPVSTVTAVIIEKDNYINLTLPEMNLLKMKYFNTLNVVLHSNDLRNKNGIFKVFLDENLYNNFKQDIIEVFRKSNVLIVSSSINKIKLLEKFNFYKSQGSIYNPGDLYIKNIEFILERIGHFSRGRKIKLIFEAQGKRENKKVKTLLNDIENNGTFYFSKDRFNHIDKNVIFYKKSDHVNGIEIADYCVYPFSRHSKNKDDTDNKLFHILLKEFVYKGDFGNYGLKEWP